MARHKPPPQIRAAAQIAASTPHEIASQGFSPLPSTSDATDFNSAAVPPVVTVAYTQRIANPPPQASPEVEARVLDEHKILDLLQAPDNHRLAKYDLLEALPSHLSEDRALVIFGEYIHHPESDVRAGAIAGLDNMLGKPQLDPKIRDQALAILRDAVHHDPDPGLREIANITLEEQLG